MAGPFDYDPRGAGFFEQSMFQVPLLPTSYANQLGFGLNQARALYDQGVYPGLPVSPTNPYQMAGVEAGAGAGETLGQYGGALAPGLTDAFGFFQNQLTAPESQSPWLTNTQDYLGLAGQVAESPYLDSQITAALRDPYRNLTEQTLPGIQRSFMGDDAGSSREAIMSGLAQRGYEDRAADVGAMMRGDAYRQGLGIADTAARWDQGAQERAARQLAGLGGQGLGYLTGGASQLYGAGQQQFGLEETQRQALERQFYQPWALLDRYTNVVNPPAEVLTGRQTINDTNLWNALLALGLQGVGGLNQQGAFAPVGDFIRGRLEEILGEGTDDLEILS